ncbi:MAG: BrnT family toxin [Ekhidna sp.]
MNFEFDLDKSKANKKKHGIDFEEAQELWKDENKFVSEAKFVGELRQLLIGKIGIKYWTAVFVIRKNVIRIISVRRARKNEKERYNSRGI